MEDIKNSFENYISQHSNKVYYSGFAIIKPSKLGSKKKDIDRVYFEIIGCNLQYWIAGHCDTNPGAIHRLKLSTDFSVIHIFNFVPEFKRSVAKGDAVEPGCFCFSPNTPGSGDDAWGILINHLNGKEAIQSYTFCFNNYSLCSKFYSALNLAYCEYHWVQMQYTNAVIGALNENPGLASGEPTKVSRLFDMYLLKVNGTVNAEWTQFYVSLVVKKVKKEGLVIHFVLYEDESRKKPVAIIERFSEVYLEISTDMSLRNNMNGFVMKDCLLKKKSSKSRVSFQPFVNEILFVSCNDNQLVQWITLIHDIAKLDNSSADLKQIVLPLADKIPNSSSALFLELSDVTIDMLFQTKQEAFKTFQSLFKAKEIAYSRALQLKQEKRKSRLSMGNFEFNEANAKNEALSASNGSKNGVSSSQQPSVGAKDRRKSRLSIYFKDLKDDSESNNNRDALKPQDSNNSVNSNSSALSRNSSVPDSIDSKGAMSQKASSFNSQKLSQKSDQNLNRSLEYSNSEASGRFFPQNQATAQSIASIPSNLSSDALNSNQYLSASTTMFPRPPQPTEPCDQQEGLFGANMIAPPASTMTVHGYPAVDRAMVTPIASGYVPYDQIPSTPLNSYYRPLLHQARYPYPPHQAVNAPPYCPTPYYYPTETGGLRSSGFFSAEFPLNPHYMHDSSMQRSFYQMPHPSVSQFSKTTFATNDEMLAANAHHFLSHSQQYDAGQGLDPSMKYRDFSSSSIFSHPNRPYHYPNASQAVPHFFANPQSNTSFLNRPVPPPPPPQHTPKPPYFT